MGQPADDLESWAEEDQPKKMTDEVVTDDTEALTDEPVGDDSDTDNTTEE